MTAVGLVEENCAHFFKNAQAALKTQCAAAPLCATLTGTGKSSLVCALCIGLGGSHKASPGNRHHQGIFGFLQLTQPQCKCTATTLRCPRCVHLA